MVGGAASAALLLAVFETEAQLVSIAAPIPGGLMVLAALYLTPARFSPDDILAMRLPAGLAAAVFVFRRRRSTKSLAQTAGLAYTPHLDIPRVRPKWHAESRV